MESLKLIISNGFQIPIKTLTQLKVQCTKFDLKKDLTFFDYYQKKKILI